jgi:hypothetical protein
MTAAKAWARPDAPRFVIKGRPWTWRTPGGPDEHGVGLVLAPANIIQFLTAEQAITLADQLVDAAETITTQPKETHHV